MDRVNIDAAAVPGSPRLAPRSMEGAKAAAGSIDYAFHDEATTRVDAPPARLFAHLDEPLQLGAHMRQRSCQMLGSRMDYRLDAQKGRAVGARLDLIGNLWGLRLEVPQVVIERALPTRKVWQTTGPPRLLVIDRYRLGFVITAAPDARSTLNVFIDYDCAGAALKRWLGRRYARWCVTRMTDDARRSFAAPRSRGP
jgi:hypothetical protein